MRVESVVIAKITHNGDRRHDPQQMAELAADVKRRGILQPLLVRAAAGEGGGFKLIAGRRRLAAAKLAGLKAVPCSILEAGDDEAAEIALVENIQREDLHPLAESELYAAYLKKFGGDVEKLAARIGKPAGYIARRLRLGVLIESARKIFAAGKMPLEAAQLVARLPEENQKELMKDLLLRGEDYYSAARVKQAAEDQFLVLSSADFGKDDETLPGGACTACKKRTGADQLLFEDMAKRDCCLDHDCFAARCAEHRKRAEAKLRAERTDFVKLSAPGQSPTKKEAGALEPWQWDETTKKDKGLKVKTGLIVNGPEAGRIVPVIVKIQTHEFDASPEAEAKGKKERAKQKAEKAAAATCLKNLFQGVSAPLTEDAVRLLAVFFWGHADYQSQRVIGRAAGWEAEKRPGVSFPDWQAAGEKWIGETEVPKLAGLLAALTCVARGKIQDDRIAAWHVAQKLTAPAEAPAKIKEPSEGVKTSRKKKK